MFVHHWPFLGVFGALYIGLSWVVCPMEAPGERYTGYGRSAGVHWISHESTTGKEVLRKSRGIILGRSMGVTWETQTLGMGLPWVSHESPV